MTMKFAELYINGNVKDDIEPDDIMMPKSRKSAATCIYNCDEHTEDSVNLQEMRRGSGLFIKKPDFKVFNSPWS